MASFNFSSVSVSTNNFSLGGPSVTLPLNIGLNSTHKGGLPTPSQLMQQSMMGSSFLRGGNCNGMMAPGFAQGFMAGAQAQQMQQMAQGCSKKQKCCKKKKKKKCCGSQPFQQNALPYMDNNMNSMCRPGMNNFSSTLSNFFGAAGGNSFFSAQSFSSNLFGSFSSLQYSASSSIRFA